MDSITFGTFGSERSPNAADRRSTGHFAITPVADYTIVRTWTRIPDQEESLSMNALTIFGIVALVVIVDIFVVIIVVRKLRRRKHEASEHLNWLAQHLNMTVTGGEAMLPGIRFLDFIKKPYRVTGSHKGCQIEIYEYTVRSNNNSTTYTTCRVETPNPRSLTFHFSREGALSKVGKILGLQDIQTGDQRFDERYIIRCNDEAFIKNAMIDSVKKQFDALWQGHAAKGNITLNKQQFGYQETGRIDSGQDCLRIAAAADLMSTLGGVVKYYNQA